MQALLIGDSQGEGLRRPLTSVLAARGYALSPASWTQVGASTTAARPHVDGVPAVDLAIVVLGGNDGSLARAGEGYAAKLADLVAQLRRAGARDVVWIGPMHADDASVAAQHDAARAVQSRGIPGARWVDGYALSIYAPHGGDGVHFTAAGYRQIAAEADKALFQSNMVTALGLVGTLAFLGSAGVIAMEALYARASSSD